jgi:hypothetical protein
MHFVWYFVWISPAAFIEYTAGTQQRISFSLLAASMHEVNAPTDRPHTPLLTFWKLRCGESRMSTIAIHNA